MPSSMLSAFNPLFKGKHKDSDPEAPPEAGNELAVASGETDAPKNVAGQSTMSPERRKVLEGVRICLLLLCLTLAALMITCTVKMLYEMPYEPIFWLYMFSMILYWILSFTLIGLSMKVYLLRNEETGVKACSKESLLREVKRIEFWVFLASLLATFICMFLLLRFAMPEVFFPSSDLRYKRLGAVTADTASMWIRDPTLGENAQIFVEYRLNGTDDPFQLSTDSANLTSDNDYAGFIRLTGLTPSTAYEFRFQQVPDETLSFRTNPAPGTPSKFSFYFGSCFLHNFPNLNEAPGFGYVLDNLKPDLFAFLGDFIYSDVPFFRDDTVGTYKSLYRQSLRNSHVRRAFTALPNYHMWDDHEIQNDFPDLRPSNMKRAGRASFENAIGMAWTTFLGGGNPPVYPGKTYFNFDYGDSSFFFVDTRVERVSNKLPDSPTKTILGSAQKTAFKNWLLDKNTTSKFKFVMSPLALTHDFPSVKDSWGGYKIERDEIFEFIRDNRIEGVVFFTGDSHFAYAVELGGAPGGMRGGLYEFSASPISAFDFSLGGFLTDPTFVPEEEREDRLMFEYTGRMGAMSLLGLTRVDTTKAVPEISVEFYDGTTHIFTANLTLEMLRPWEAA